MHRLLAILFSVIFAACAADGAGVEGQSEPLRAENVGTRDSRLVASAIPTRVVPASKIKELSLTLAAEQKETTAEDLAKSYSYLQDVGDPDCAYTDLCGSGGGNYSGCVFGYCAWCQTWAVCHYQDGTANPNELAICDPGPCHKP